MKRFFILFLLTVLFGVAFFSNQAFAVPPVACYRCTASYEIIEGPSVDCEKKLDQYCMLYTQCYWHDSQGDWLGTPPYPPKYEYRTDLADGKC